MPWRDAHDHVAVLIEPGRDAKEELAVEVRPDGTYQLLAPPALTLGLAVGDVFTIDAASSRARVIGRSGNLTIWLYPHRAHTAARALEGKVRSLGGEFEGSAQGDVVFMFTVPVAASFSAIEAVFNGFVQDQPASEWLYGNVYADDGITPLGWWEQAEG